MNKHRSVILWILPSLLLIFFSGICFSWAQEGSTTDVHEDEKISLTLQKAIEIALSKNKGILVVKEKVKEAEQISFNSS